MVIENITSASQQAAELVPSTKYTLCLQADRLHAGVFKDNLLYLGKVFWSITLFTWTEQIIRNKRLLKYPKGQDHCVIQRQQNEPNDTS